MATAVRWQYKKDLRMADNKAKAWADYTAEEAQKLEALYQTYKVTKADGKLSADYSVDFKDMFQYRNDDANRQRPVRRLDP